jgi:hypothetical protein
MNSNMLMQVFQSKKPSVNIQGGGSFMEHLRGVFK